MGIYIHNVITLNGSRSHLPTPTWSNAASTTSILTAGFGSQVSLSINSTGLLFTLVSGSYGILDGNCAAEMLVSSHLKCTNYNLYKCVYTYIHTHTLHFIIYIIYAIKMSQSGICQWGVMPRWD